TACGRKIKVQDFDISKVIKNVFCKKECNITPECQNKLKGVFNFLQQFVNKVKCAGYYEDPVEQNFIIEDINNPFYKDRKLFKQNLIRKYQNNEFTFKNIANLIPQFAIDKIEPCRILENIIIENGLSKSAGFINMNLNSNSMLDCDNNDAYIPNN